MKVFGPNAASLNRKKGQQAQASGRRGAEPARSTPTTPEPASTTGWRVAAKKPGSRLWYLDMGPENVMAPPVKAALRKQFQEKHAWGPDMKFESVIRLLGCLIVRCKLLLESVPLPIIKTVPLLDEFFEDHQDLLQTVANLEPSASRRQQMIETLQWIREARAHRQWGYCLSQPLKAAFARYLRWTAERDHMVMEKPDEVVEGCVRDADCLLMLNGKAPRTGSPVIKNMQQLRALMDERARLVIDCHCRPAGRHTKRCENLKARFSALVDWVKSADGDGGDGMQVGAPDQPGQQDESHTQGADQTGGKKKRKAGQTDRRDETTAPSKDKKKLTRTQTPARSIPTPRVRSPTRQPGTPATDATDTSPHVATPSGTPGPSDSSESSVTVVGGDDLSVESMDGCSVPPHRPNTRSSSSSEVPSGARLKRLSVSMPERVYTLLLHWTTTVENADRQRGTTRANAAINLIDCVLARVQSGRTKFSDSGQLRKFYEANRTVFEELAGGPSADAIHDLNVLLYHMG